MHAKLTSLCSLMDDGIISPLDDSPSVDSTSPQWSSLTVQQLQDPAQLLQPGSLAALAGLSNCPEAPQLGGGDRRDLRGDAEVGRALHHCQLWVLTGACKAPLCYRFGIPVLAEPCQSSSAPSGLSVQEEEVWDDSLLLCWQK